MKSVRLVAQGVDDENAVTQIGLHAAHERVELLAGRRDGERRRARAHERDATLGEGEGIWTCLEGSTGWPVNGSTSMPTMSPVPPAGLGASWSET